MGKTAYILTFGCQMNDYDSEVLESILSANGYVMTDKPDIADLAIINTCSVRQKAESRAMANIARLASLKKKRPTMKIVVAGCMAKRAGQSILKEIPGVDYVVGPDYIPDIAVIVQNGTSERVLISEESDTYGLSDQAMPRGVTAYIAISRGCDNFCSYCIVPYVRGSFRSRPVNNIIAEMRLLVEGGIKDVTLLGQNVNSYRDGDADFPGLLRILSVVAPPRLRFLTSHPKDLSDDLIRCFSEVPNLCESLHLPLQSGSDKILKVMNRGYSLKRYLSIIERLRKTVPDISLSTDLIVGFPGETEDDFEMTLKVVQDIAFDSAFMFRYSVRPGTEAAKLPDDVPESVKIDRLNRLIAVQQEIAEKMNDRWLGRRLEVLIEGDSRRQPTMPKGRSRGGQSVLITNGGNIKPGDIVDVKICSSRARTLFGELTK